jgi:hypothetical protein
LYVEELLIKINKKKECILMKEQLLNQLIQFVLSILGLLASYVLTILGQYLSEKKQKMSTEKDRERYNRALEVAKGIYLVLEDEFKDITKAGEEKKAQMEEKLLQLIPELTKEELDAINKQVWNEFNEKVVKVITTPIE